MKSRSAFKGLGVAKDRQLEAPKLPSVDPTADQEAKLSDLARSHKFHDRDPSVVEDSDKAAGLMSLIPTRSKVASEKAETKEEIRKKFAECLSSGKPLPMPSDLRHAGLARERFYQVMPVHVSEALTALTEAHGYEKEWQLIAEMMRALGGTVSEDE